MTTIENTFGKPCSLHASSAEAISFTGGEYDPGKTFIVYVGTAGNIKVETANGESVLLKSAKPGTTVPLLCRKVLEAQTNADNLVAFLNG